MRRGVSLIAFSIFLCVLSVVAQMSMDMTSSPSGSATESPFCVTRPWSSNCTEYQYPENLIKLDNDDLCMQMDFMVGCSVEKLCKANPSALGDKPFCQPFSILADTCDYDMPMMRGCKNYVSMCAPLNSTVKQCKESGVLPSIPTTSDVNKAVREICGSHTMDGCEKCTFASATAYGNCDLLAVYSSLCIAMPNMAECSWWSKMCAANSDSSLTAYCGGDSSSTPPVMKMYFHDEVTYVLFKSWVPRTSGEFAGAFFAMIAGGIVVEALMAFRPHIERSLLSDLVARNKKEFTFTLLLYTSRTMIFIPVVFLLRGIEVLIGYLLMLAAMSFNIVVFSGVIVGLALGHVIWLPYRLSHSADEKENSTACC